MMNLTQACTAADHEFTKKLRRNYARNQTMLTNEQTIKAAIDTLAARTSNGTSREAKSSKKLYLLSQTENTYDDTYDAMVVCAETEDKAVAILPAGVKWQTAAEQWASHPSNITVKLLGLANTDTPEGVVLASYNAGH